MSHNSEPKPLYSLRDVAKLLQLSDRSISRMIDACQIKAVRIRSRWMVKHEDFTAYLDGQQTNQR